MEPIIQGRFIPEMMSKGRIIPRRIVPKQTFKDRSAGDTLFCYLFTLFITPPPPHPQVPTYHLFLLIQYIQGQILRILRYLST
jgi:hypothetical protein